MAIILENPTLFYSLDTVLQLISMLIALLIVGFSYKAYLFTKDKEYYYYSLAFVLIASAFFINALANIIIYLTASPEVKGLLPYFNLGIFAYRILTLLGFTLLMLVTLRIGDRRVVTLLVIFSLVAALFSREHRSLFFLLYIVVLSFTTVQLYFNYLKTKSRLALATLGLFSFLLLAQVSFFAMVVDTLFKTYYAAYLYYIGQALQITSYLLLFYIMIRISRK